MKYKPYNKKDNHAYALGIYPVLELLKYKAKYIVKVVVNSKQLENKDVKEILKLCIEESINYEVNDNLINRLGYKENTYVVGIFNKYESKLTDNNHIVLVNPTNSGNLGTIIRTMVGFNFKNLVIIKPAVDIFEPKVISSTTGAIFKINFKYFNNIKEYLDEYKEHNIYTFMLNAKEELSNVKFKSPTSLIFGNENTGLSKEFLNIGESIKIPHSSELESLNLSVSASIAMWEVFNH